MVLNMSEGEGLTQDDEFDALLEEMFRADAKLNEIEDMKDRAIQIIRTGAEEKPAEVEKIKEVLQAKLEEAEAEKKEEDEEIAQLNDTIQKCKVKDLFHGESWESHRDDIQSYARDILGQMEEGSSLLRKARKKQLELFQAHNQTLAEFGTGFVDLAEAEAEQDNQLVELVDKLCQELSACINTRKLDEMCSARRKIKEECDRKKEEAERALERIRQKNEPPKEVIRCAAKAIRGIAEAEAKKRADAEMALIVQESDKQTNPIPFYGSEDEHFIEGKDAIVSFPGVHGYGWKKLTAISSSKDTPLATSCIFLPDDKAPGYGRHDLQRGGPKCHCHDLYGKQEEWGCNWFSMWKTQTQAAALGKCNLIVVTKKDGSLGNSQKGEVKFLKDRKLEYTEITIEKFARKILSDSAETFLPRHPRLPSCPESIFPTGEKVWMVGVWLSRANADVVLRCLAGTAPPAAHPMVNHGWLLQSWVNDSTAAGQLQTMRLSVQFGNAVTVVEMDGEIDMDNMEEQLKDQGAAYAGKPQLGPAVDMTWHILAGIPLGRSAEFEIESNIEGLPSKKEGEFTEARASKRRWLGGPRRLVRLRQAMVSLKSSPGSQNGTGLLQTVIAMKAGWEGLPAMEKWWLMDG
eukprot:Skav235440  [mRNA]  locus=scaffold2206:25873:32970:- [translate_table: standard]